MASFIATTTSPNLTFAHSHRRDLSASSLKTTPRSIRSQTYADENNVSNIHQEYFGRFKDVDANIISTPSPIITEIAQFGRKRSIGHNEESATPQLLKAHRERSPNALLPMTALLPIETN